MSPARAREAFELGDDGRDWTVALAKADVSSSGPHPRFLSPILYRPFDLRFTYWTGRTKGFMAYPRREVMQHVVGRTNVGMIFNRQVVGDSVSHFGVARVPICHGTFYLGNKGQDYFAPLWLFDSDLLSGNGSGHSNFSDTFLAALRAQLGEGAAPSPEQAFHFIYGIFHSQTYRSRYAEFLRIDFPRVPLTGSRKLFHSLAGLGSELVALHLLESSKVNHPITEYLGGRAPEVEKVSWSNNTVWLDKAQTVGFKGVREEVWNFHIGGYQVCEKWLKDRKGRRLSKDDIAHYQKIVVALSETIRLMKEIDEVIEQHGGWPGAFQTGEAKAAPAKVVPFRPRTVDPKPAERYITCVPLVPLKAAAGAFGDPQHVEDDGFEWVVVESCHRLRKGMFVAQVVGKSMEPAIPDGAYCLFRAPVEGTRQGKNILVQLRDATDPETGQRYTVKRYDSEKATTGDSWRHERITLKPVNPDFEPIVLTGKDDGELKVIAEFVEVLSGGQPDYAAPPADRAGFEQPRSFELRSPEYQPSLLDHSTERGERPDLQGHASTASQPRALDLEDLTCRIRALFADGRPRDRDAAIRELCTELESGDAAGELREAMDNGLRTAVRRGILSSQAGTLRLHLSSIDDYDRDFLKEQFLASLGGRAWRDRSDVSRVLARFLGFRRTGPAIETAVRSIINGLIRERRLEVRGDEIRRSD